MIIYYIAGQPAGLPSQSRPACLRRAGRLAFAEPAGLPSRCPFRKYENTFIVCTQKNLLCIHKRFFCVYTTNAVARRKIIAVSRRTINAVSRQQNIGNTIGKTIRNTIGNTIGKTTGKSIGNSIK